LRGAGGLAEEEEEEDEDEDEDEYFQKLQNARGTKKKPTVSMVGKKRKRTKSSSSGDDNDDDDEDDENSDDEGKSPFDKFAVSDANVDTFNRCILNWNDAARRRQRNAYQKRYKELLDEFTPDDNTKIEEVALHVMDRVQKSKSHSAKCRKMKEDGNVISMAYHVYIGMLLNTAMEKLAFKTGFDYNVNTCRTRRDPLLKAAYKWLRSSSIKISPRQFRRYIFLYELGYEQPYASWLLICGVPPYSLMRWSEFLYRFFAYQHVVGECRACLESTSRRLKIRVFEQADFVPESLIEASQ